MTVKIWSYFCALALFINLIDLIFNYLTFLITFNSVLIFICCLFMQTWTQNIKVYRLHNSNDNSLWIKIFASLPFNVCFSKYILLIFNGTMFILLLLFLKVIVKLKVLILFTFNLQTLWMILHSLQTFIKSA